MIPRIERRVETYEDIESFYDRWQHILGTAVIDSPPPFERTDLWPGDSLSEAVTPQHVVRRESLRCMTIYSDGSVPADDLDLAGRHIAGNAATESLVDIWRNLIKQRMQSRV